MPGLSEHHPIALVSGCTGERTGGVCRVLPIREKQASMPVIPGMVCAYVSVWWQRWVVSGGIRYTYTIWEVEGLVSVERWSCSRGASCVVEHIMRRLKDWFL